MQALALVVASCVVGWSSGACFKPALEREVDVDDTEDSEDSAEVQSDTDTSETPADSAGDTLNDALDTTDALDTLSPPEDTADTHTTDTSPACSVDGECLALARPPCVVGRCVQQHCAAVNVSVPCDDGDVCTTADQCQAGTCSGRAFTAEESKNWAIQLSGPGEDAAVAAYADPSGDVLVTGAFTGTVTLPTGAPLVASGSEADAFLLQLTTRGQVLRAIRLGTERRDVGVSVASAEDVAQKVVGLNTLNPESSIISSSIHWVNNNGTLRATLPLPGQLVRLDSQPDGVVVAVLEFEGEVSLELAGGGQLSFSSQVRNAIVLACSSQGVLWANKISSDETVQATAIVLVNDRVRVAVATDTLPVSYAGTLLGTGGHLIDIDSGGRYQTHTTLADGFVQPSGFARQDSTLTFLRFGNEGVGEFFPRVEIRHGQAPGCTIDMPFDPENESAAWGFGRSWSRGFFVQGLAIGSIDLGAGVLAFPGQSGGLLASYDDQCLLRAAWRTELALLDNGPSTLSFASNDLEFFIGEATAIQQGGVVMASTVRFAKTLGPDFDNLLITPLGGSDALIGGYSPARALGCTQQQNATSR